MSRSGLGAGRPTEILLTPVRRAGCPHPAAIDHRIIMMEIMTGETAARIREAYIRRFVDTTAAYYITNIQHRTPCSDGMCYSGYLWDCFRKPRPMSREACLAYLSGASDTCYVFWDIHSKDRILIPDYWKYPKDAVLRVTPDELLARMADLPEDIYIFDDTYSWSIALTHETDAQERPYCLFTDT